MITGVLTDCEELEEILLRIRPEMLHDIKIRTVANAIWSKQTTSLSVIADEIANYGMDAFALQEIVSASIDGDISEIIEIIVNRHVSHEMLLLSKEFTKALAAGEDVHEQTEIFDIAKDRIISEHDTTQTPHISISTKKVSKGAHDAAEGIFTGIPTGYSELDELTGGGWQPSNQIVLSGPSSHGKTTAMLNFAHELAIQGIPVLIITCESPAIELTRRLICKVSGISIKELKMGPGPGVDKEAWKKEVDYWAAEIDKLPIFIEESDCSLTKILNVYRANVRNNGVRAVFLDYLQCVRTTEKFNTVDLMYGHISRRLKSCANLYGTINFPLMQVTKAPVTEKRPAGKGDMRNGGLVDQDADMIIMFMIPENYHPDVPHPVDDNGNSTKGMMKWMIAKHRDGALGIITKKVDHYFRITSWAKEDDDFAEDPPQQNIIERASTADPDNFDDVPF